MLDRLFWPFTDRYVLVLGSGQLHLLRQRVWQRKPSSQWLETVPLDVHASMDTVSQALTAPLQKWPTRGRGLSVVLGADWVHFAHVSPPPNARHPQDLAAAASMQLQKMLETAPGETAVVCDPTAHLPFVGSAMHRPLLTAFTRAAADRHMHVCGVVPEFAVVWNHWCGAVANGEWLGVCTPHSLTLGLVAHGRLQAVRLKRMPGLSESAPDWLTEVVAQEALRHNLDVPTGLALCGQVPPAWLGLPRVISAKKLTCRVLGEAADAFAVWGVTK